MIRSRPKMSRARVPAPSSTTWAPRRMVPPLAQLSSRVCAPRTWSCHSEMSAITGCGPARLNSVQDQVRGAHTRDESCAKGGTMRLGAQEVLLGAGTRARDIFGRDLIMERHRPRYEFNNNYLDRYRQSGMRFSGFSRDNPEK